MFKNIKLEHKIILAFMLPIMMMLSIGILPYFHSRRMYEETRMLGDIALDFIQTSTTASDENAVKYKNLIEEREKKISAMMKQQQLISVIMIQINILILMLIAFLMAKHIRQMVEVEKQKSADAEKDAEFVAGILAGILLEYKNRSGKNPLEVLKKLEPILSQRLKVSRF